MRVRILPGGIGEGRIEVPGDRSIACRWLILGVTARGRTRLLGIPRSLDALAMLSCLAALAPRSTPALEAAVADSRVADEPGRFTWDAAGSRAPDGQLALEGEGWDGLAQPSRPLDCENSATTMRLLAGVAASRSFRTLMTGDRSLRRRPMERVAEPLRAMGAEVRTTEGHPPIEIAGNELRGVTHRTSPPSAQVKGAVLFAGLTAGGETVVEEAAPTRDHTERALRSLGAPVRATGGRISLRAFQHAGFSGTVPGDVSSAAFPIAAAAVSGSRLRVDGVGLNPTRTQFLRILRRMGVDLSESIDEDRLGEPVGSIEVAPTEGLRAVTVTASELPLVIDEVPVLAVIATHSAGESRFEGAAELRVKEADRLAGLAAGIRSLGGRAHVDGDDLVVEGGGLAGGRADGLGDHRLAMAFAVGALAARGPCEIDGMQASAVSFPGFLDLLGGLGANLQEPA